MSNDSNDSNTLAESTIQNLYKRKREIENEIKEEIQKKLAEQLSELKRIKRAIVETCTQQRVIETSSKEQQIIQYIENHLKTSTKQLILTFPPNFGHFFDQCMSVPMNKQDLANHRRCFGSEYRFNIDAAVGKKYTNPDSTTVSSKLMKLLCKHFDFKHWYKSVAMEEEIIKCGKELIADHFLLDDNPVHGDEYCDDTIIVKGNLICSDEDEWIDCLAEDFESDADEWKVALKRCDDIYYHAWIERLKPCENDETN